MVFKLQNNKEDKKEESFPIATFYINLYSFMSKYQGTHKSQDQISTIAE